MKILRNQLKQRGYRSVKGDTVRYFDHEGHLIGSSVKNLLYNSNGLLAGSIDNNGSVFNATGKQVAVQRQSLLLDMHGDTLGRFLPNGEFIDEDGEPSSLLEAAGLVITALNEALFVSESAGSWGSAGSCGSEGFIDDDDEADYELG